MGACFFCQAEDGIRDGTVTGVQTCALPILALDEAESSEASADSITEAFGWCERSKARGLIDLLSGQGSKITAHADKSLLNRVRRLHEELTSRHIRATAETRLLNAAAPG